ncbi:hypothetical protein M426DRAFT_14562 [Hypoxylon sp. CI-4A]|nr:hypothetical protein M426DRAFT_14562 [Hypoxylon sp. CI-4A]
MDALKLPEVQVSSLPTRSSHKAVEVDNDYGTLNLLFSYYVPHIPSGTNAHLATILKEFQSWNAWELAVAEDQVQIQIGQGNLPRDDSVESRVRRNNYRAKVVAFLRDDRESSWLLFEASSQENASLSGNTDEVSSAIHRLFHDHYAGKQGSGQSAALINIISNSVALEPSMTNNYYQTIVYFDYDQERKMIQPRIEVASVTVTETEQKSDGPPAALNINIGFQDYVYKLKTDQWSDYGSSVPDMIKAGEGILREMALNFFHPPQATPRA